MSATSSPASSASPAIPLYHLPRKYIVGIGLCVLLALLSVGLLIRYQYQGTIEEWKNRLSSIADGEELYINSWVLERNGDLAVLSARPALASTLLPSLREADRRRRVAEALPLIDRVVVAYDYTAIYMVDRAGVIRISSSGAPALPRALIETAPDFTQSKFEVLPDDLAGQLGARILLTKPIWAGVPRADFREGVGGVLGRVFVLSRANLIHSLPSLGTTSTRTGESVLIRREGNGAVFLSSLRHLTSIPPERRSSLRPPAFAASSVLEGRVSFGQVEDYRGVRVLEVTRLIPGVGWGLITKIDRAEALENFYALAGLELAGAAIVLFVLVAISFKSSHDRQIQGLQEEITRREQAEEQLRLSREQLAVALKAGQSGTFEWDIQTDVNTWSPEIDWVYGFAPGEFNRTGAHKDWLNLVLPEDRAVAKAAVDHALKTGEYAAEWRVCRRTDGQIRWVLGQGKVIFNETGLPIRLIGINADITARRQAEERLRRTNQTLQALSECNEALMRATDESTMLQRVCDAAVRGGGYRMAWVGYAEHDENKKVRPVAKAGLEDGYLKTANVSWADVEQGGRGPTGIAIRTGEVVVVRDVATDPRFARWQGAAKQRGYRSSITIPLRSANEVFGALMIYSTETDAFDSQEQRLLEELANDMTYAIMTLRARGERTRAEQALLLERERLAVALKAGKSGTFDWDLQTAIAIWSPELEELHGLGQGEFLGYEDCERLVLPEDLAAATAAIDQAMKIGEFAGEWRICRRSDGQIRWVLGRGKVIFDETGRPARMFGINADITALKHTEEELRLSEERFSSAFEYAPIGLALVSPTGRWIKVNKSLCDLVGYSAEELHEKTFQDITHPDDLEADLEYVRQMLAGEIYSYRMEKRYFHKSGRIVWISLSVSLVRDNKGQPLHFITQIEDITARKTAAEAIRKLNEELEQRVAQRTAELQASNQELESFSYSVSHDLRAPLRSINGFSRILMEEYGPQLINEAQRYLQVIQKNAIRMGALIDDLLAFSRLGRQALRTQVVVPTDLVHQAFEDLHDEQEGRQIEIDVGELPVCQGDPALLRQVFVNLFSNALKYSRPRTVAHIEVGAGRLSDLNGQMKSSTWPQGIDAASTVYYVRDNGVGFDMQYANQLFGVFQRLHGAEEFEGTGVGLAIVKRIIHKHGGQVWAEAEPQKGAAFYFTVQENSSHVPADSSVSTEVA